MSIHIIEKVNMTSRWDAFRSLEYTQPKGFEDFFTLMRSIDQPIGLFLSSDLDIVAYVSTVNDTTHIYHNKAGDVLIEKLQKLVTDHQSSIAGMQLLFNQKGQLCAVCTVNVVSYSPDAGKVINYSGMVEIAKLLSIDYVKPDVSGKVGDVLYDIAGRLLAKQTSEIMHLVNDRIVGVSNRSLPYVLLAQMPYYTLKRFATLGKSRTDPLEKEFWLALYDTDTEMFHMVDKANWDFPHVIEQMELYISVADRILRERNVTNANL